MHATATQGFRSVFRAFGSAILVALLASACGGGGGGGDGGIGLEDLNQDGQIRILCFGDSITRGTGDGPEATEDPPLPAGYPARLQVLLGVPVDNGGRPGEQTTEGLDRIAAELGRSRPDYVILLEGINDVIQGRGNVVVTNLRTMIDEVFRSGALPILGTLTPTCCRRERSLPESTVRDLNHDIRNLAFEEGVSLIDFFEAFVSPDPSFDPTSGLIHDPEGLHPTPAGYDVMAMTAADAF